MDGYYMSLNGEGESLYRISRECAHADHVNLMNNGRNFEFVADVAGEYIFTWNYASFNLEVTFPSGEGIENTHADTKAVKRIINGQLVIEKNGALFNAIGVQVK